ncbi:MAG: hypothetical protein KC461_13390 [Dehalococcoidia bacterium]|nr:hypothetical protein [Dehalococcoidia bacterium]
MTTMSARAATPSDGPPQRSASPSSDGDDLNLAVVTGTISSEPVWRDLPSGSRLLEFSVTSRSDTGATSVPVVWEDPPRRAASLAADSRVVVRGHIRRRFFRAGGATASRTELVAAQVSSGRARRSVASCLAAAATLLERHQR